MHRIDGAGHVNGKFVHEDPATNRPPTEITESWLNSIQEEVATVIEKTGVVLDKAKKDQLYAAIVKIAAAAYGYATFADAGLVQLASLSDTATGTNSTRVVTPSTLKQETLKLAAAIHAHPINQVTGLPAALDGLSAAIANHLHAIDQVDGLRAALDGKLNTVGSVFSLRAQAGAASLNLLSAASNPGSYLKGHKGAIESWYVGAGTTNTDDVYLWSYIYDTYLSLRADRVLANKQIYIGSNPVYHGGNISAAPLLGIGQAWTDVTAARASNTTYTNTTGRPIYVIVCASTQIAVWVGGIEVLVSQGGENNTYLVVPPGATYSATSSNIRKWSELR